MHSFIRFKDRFSSRGSFLISTALFLVAASMIGVVLLRMYQMFDYNKKLHTSQQRLAAVQESLDDYYGRTGRLPYPSAPAANTDGNNFGQEAVNEFGNWTPAVGTVRVDGRMIAGAPQRVIIGALPTRVLGLSDSYAIDKWGNKLIYAVTEDYADATPVPSTVDRGGITVQDEFNRNATSEQGNVIYIVLTHGPDKRGAFNLNGQRPIPCPAAGLAVENCDDDAVFVNTVNKSYDPNIGPNTYTYSAVYRAFPAGHDWVVGAWGPCDSVDCSTGNQPRTVDCRATNNTLLLDAVCLADRGPKPPLTQTCAAAFTCQWIANGFTPAPPLCASSPAGAPVTCGGGFREQQVLCRRSDGLDMPYHNPWGVPLVATPAMQATADAQCGAVPPRPPHQETCLPAACVCGPANGGTFAVEPPNAQKCAAPAPNVVAPATGGAPAWQWTWRCNGGSTFAADDSPPCSANRQAQCGAANGVGSAVAPAAGLCNVGNASAVAGGAGAPWTWTCTGTGAGNTDACSAPAAAPVNGVCGVANNVFIPAAPPVADRCSSGTPSAVVGTGPWTWTCNGSGGGTNTTCGSLVSMTNTGCGSCPFGSSTYTHTTLFLPASSRFCTVPMGYRSKTNHAYQTYLGVGGFPDSNWPENKSWHYPKAVDSGYNVRGTICHVTGKFSAFVPQAYVDFSWTIEKVSSTPATRWVDSGMPINGAWNPPGAQQVTIETRVEYPVPYAAALNVNSPLDYCSRMSNRPCTDTNKYAQCVSPGITTRWYRCQ